MKIKHYHISKRHNINLDQTLLCDTCKSETTNPGKLGRVICSDTRVDMEGVRIDMDMDMDWFWIELIVAHIKKKLQ